MKSLFAILTIIGFLGIAVFGIFGMNHGTIHSLNGCIAASVQSMNCSIYEKAFSFLTFHFEFFKGFSTAVFGKNFNAALLIAAAFLSAVGLLVSSSLKKALADAPFFTGANSSNSIALPIKRQFVRWLAIHENSPSAL